MAEQLIILLFNLYYWVQEYKQTKKNLMTRISQRHYAYVIDWNMVIFLVRPPF